MEKRTCAPFLSFTGKAEEAMRFYESVFPGAKITRLEPYGKSSPHMGPGEEGRIMHGAMEIMGREVLFLDMSDKYPAPAFSWASSIMVGCAEEAEFDAIFAALSKEGSVMMGPEAVGPIRKCAWVVDKFGVTWQPVWE
ncbi:MAG: VOC family protein [Treponema sp.]|nr:VOC family protein [Treponema sp.]